MLSIRLKIKAIRLNKRSFQVIELFGFFTANTILDAENFIPTVSPELRDIEKIVIFNSLCKLS